MRRILICCMLCICSALTLFLGGCAAPQSKPAKVERFFWPVLPDIPRIEFLDAHTGPASMRRNDPKGLVDILLGDSVDEEKLLTRPVSLTSDGMGNVYVIDQSSLGVIHFNLKAKTMKLLGGDAAASTAFARGTGITIDSNANIYAADAQSKKIYVFSKAGDVTAVYDTSQHIESVGGMAVDKIRKRLIVIDIKGHKLVVFGLDGSFIEKLGKRGDGEYEFNYPNDVSVDKDGNILVCDSMNARIMRFTHDLKFINKFGKRGDGIGELAVPKGVATDSEGHIYVTDGKTNKIVIFSDNGDVLLQFGAAFAADAGKSIAPGGFRSPMGIFIDQNDTIYVADAMNARFHIYQYMNQKYVKENPY